MWRDISTIWHSFAPRRQAMYEANLLAGIGLAILAQWLLYRNAE